MNECRSCAELTMTRDPYDPLLDHGMSRSRLLTNHDEFMTILPSLLCDYVQSGLLGFAYSVNIFILIYSKSSTVVYSPHDIITSRTR